MQHDRPSAVEQLRGSVPASAGCWCAGQTGASPHWRSRPAGSAAHCCRSPQKPPPSSLAPALLIVYGHLTHHDGLGRQQEAHDATKLTLSVPATGSNNATGLSACRTSHTRTGPSPPAVASSGGPVPAFCTTVSDSERTVKQHGEQMTWTRERSCCHLPAAAIDAIDDLAMSLRAVDCSIQALQIPDLQLTCMHGPRTLSCKPCQPQLAVSAPV